MSDSNTQKSIQPSYNEITPQPKKPNRKITADEEIRRAAKYDVRQMIVQGFDGPTIIKKIRETYDVAYTTAKRYLNNVYEDINKLKAGEGSGDRELQTWLAEERYKMAFKIAYEKKDPRYMIEANRRLAELQGLVPDGNGGVTINNVMAGNIPHVSPEAQRLSNQELENIIDVPHKRLEQQRVTDSQALTAEQAEQLLSEDDD